MEAPKEIYAHRLLNGNWSQCWEKSGGKGKVKYIRADLAEKELKETVEVAEDHAYCAGMIKGQEEFRALVKEMREAQKQYFKYRTNEALSKSKQLEKRVDEELSGQGKLFE